MPNAIKMPPPELFMGKQDGKTVKQFINACNTYFKLTGIKEVKKPKHFFQKIGFLTLQAFGITIRAIITTQ